MGSSEPQNCLVAHGLITAKVATPPAALHQRRTDSRRHELVSENCLKPPAARRVVAYEQVARWLSPWWGAKTSSIRLCENSVQRVAGAPGLKVELSSQERAARTKVLQSKALMHWAYHTTLVGIGRDKRGINTAGTVIPTHYKTAPLRTHAACRITCTVIPASHAYLGHVAKYDLCPGASGGSGSRLAWRCLGGFSPGAPTHLHQRHWRAQLVSVTFRVWLSYSHLSCRVA